MTNRLFDITTATDSEIAVKIATLRERIQYGMDHPYEGVCGEDDNRSDALDGLLAEQKRRSSSYCAVCGHEKRLTRWHRGRGWRWVCECPAKPFAEQLASARRPKEINPDDYPVDYDQHDRNAAESERIDNHRRER